MKYFSMSEFDCKETGENKMQPEFLQRLELLREACGFPFIITSGYRSVKHSVEAKKVIGGTHTQGIAADIAVSDGTQRRAIVEAAISLGFNGIGVNDNFVHVDTRKSARVLWVY